MKIYHVNTREAYDELMIELEEKGYSWLTGQKPTYFRYWEKYGVNTCVRTLGKCINFSTIEWYKKEYPDTPVIEYKEKGETKMTNEEMKQKIHGLATYVSIAAESLARDIKFESKE